MNFDKYFGRFNNVVNENLEIFVRLYYAPKIEVCPNCIVDTFGGSYNSTGEYKTGGPIPFDTGVCPYCDGRGTKEVEVYNSITARVYFSPQKDGLVDLAKSKFVMISKIEHFDQIKRCNYCVPLDGVQDMEYSKYKMEKSPVVNNFRLNPQKYVESYWVKM